MTKEKVRKEARAEVNVVSNLSARENYAICWAARKAYDDIKDYFIEDCNDRLVSNYMSVICLLHKENEENALYMVSTLLEQAFAYDTWNLIMELCHPEDGSIEIFIKELLATAYEDLVEPDEEEEDEWEDEDFDDDFKEGEVDERPFAVITVYGDDEKMPGFKEALKHVMKVIGFTPNDLKKKECEEDE